MTTSAANSSWLRYALLSAVFAALTAILAKVGTAGVNNDMATLIRLVVILGALRVLGVFVYATGRWTNPAELPSKAWLFLVLSGLATGASWTCYVRALKVGGASKVAPVDKLSLVLEVIFAVAFLGGRLSWRESAGIAMVAAGVMVLALK